MNNILYADRIKFLVPRRDKPIISETSISIFPQDFAVILGHNGSGKSSLIKILSGERKPTSGQVFIGQELLMDIPASRKAIELISISQTIEDRLFLELTIAENIDLWESRFNKSDRLKYDQIFFKFPLLTKFSKCLNQKLLTLSGGEKQILILAMLFAHPPNILFLDESTATLDPKAAEETMYFTASAIAEHKITSLMVTHNLNDAINYGNRLIILHEGKIVFDQKKPNNLSIKELKEMISSLSSIEFYG